MELKRLVAGLAFLTSVTAFLVIVGGGLALVLIESSGERGAGALLALCGAICFAAAMMILFAAERAFARHGGKAGALTMTLLAALPPAALSIGALRFAGFPYGSGVPLLWGAFAAGLVLALGALSVLVVGYGRMGEARPAPPRREASRPPSSAEVTLQSAVLSREDAFRQAAERRQLLLDAEREETSESAAAGDDEVRVTPVDLPSIGQFRRQ